MKLENFISTLSQHVGTEKILVVRNFRGLPIRNPANDIDILVSEAALPRWEAAFENTAQVLGLHWRKTSHHYYVAKYVFFTAPEASGKPDFYLEIDLNFSLNWRGLKFGEVERLLSETEVHVGPIHIMKDPGDRAFVTFCHSFLYGGFINPKYLGMFLESALAESPTFRVQMKRVFAQGDAAYLITLLSRPDAHISRAHANWIRIRALLKSSADTPVSTIGVFLKALLPPRGRVGRLSKSNSQMGRISQW